MIFSMENELNFVIAFNIFENEYQEWIETNISVASCQQIGCPDDMLSCTSLRSSWYKGRSTIDLDCDCDDWDAADRVVVRFFNSY